MVFDIQFFPKSFMFYLSFSFPFFFLTQGNVPLLSLPASSELLLSEVTFSLEQRNKQATTETSKVIYGHNRVSLTDSKVTTYICNKQYHRKILLSSFHLNGHTIGFHQHT